MGQRLERRQHGVSPPSIRLLLPGTLRQKSECCTVWTGSGSPHRGQRRAPKRQQGRSAVLGSIPAAHTNTPPSLPNDRPTPQGHSVTVAVTMAGPQHSGMWPIMAPSVLCEGTLLQDRGTSRWPHPWVGLIQSTEGLKKVLFYESAIFPFPWAPISVHTCACTPTHTPTHDNHWFCLLGE